MPHIHYPIVKLVNGADTFTASHHGENKIEYQPNGAQIAKITLDNTDGSISWTQNDGEDRVTVLVSDGTTDYEMLDGYITWVENEKLPGGRKCQIVEVADYGGFLAPKTIFEKDYWKTRTVKTGFEDAAAEITGITTNVSASLTDNIKRNFLGSVKDAWTYLADVGKADWFVDESLVLQAFPSSGANKKELQTGGTTYKIQDTIATLSNEIMVDHAYKYSYKFDATERIRTVKVTSGISETFPSLSNLNLLQTDTFWHDRYGKTFSTYYTPFDESLYAPQTSSVEPIGTSDTLDINGNTIPVLSFNVPTTGATLLIEVRRRVMPTATAQFKLFNIPIDDFREIRLFLRNSLATATMNDLRLELADSTGVNYWYYDIKKSGVGAYNDLNTTSWTFLKYELPTSTSLGTKPAWTKVGTPTRINSIVFRPTPTSGYTGSLDFAWLHLYGRKNVTATSAGTPATEKLIVDRSLKDTTSLTTRANNEKSRINVQASRPQATIIGHTDFKKPGYFIDVDFDTTLGVTSSGSVRMAKIVHQFTPKWRTTIMFNDSFQRV